MSGHQAKPDFTIDEIVEELFEDKTYTDEEKARIIYDFVGKNIRYSSIDFRQSSHIPQKASTVYHSRLGDCKDISTLYASVAREVDLPTNLILINTRNNGQKDVLLPSLNFNHCIVKVDLGDKPVYLELTDPDLPFGHLYSYHQGAAVLEIPQRNIPKDIQLEYLTLNPGYENANLRTGTVEVGASEKVTVTKKAIKTGTKAASTCSAYYNEDETERKEKMKKSVSKGFTSPVKLESVSFEKLEPRSKEAIYHYKYSVENEVLKVGSFRSLKIPFADVLLSNSILEKEEEERNHDFDFIYYENTDTYDETIDIKLAPSFTFVEVPQNLHYEFKGCVYDLRFEKINDQHIRARRKYTVMRENIPPKDFNDFKTFAKQVIEAEKTNVVFK